MVAGDMMKFVFWKGDDGGVTGRMGMWESAFRMVDGYDEDMLGHGAQDIDLKNRFASHPLTSAERALVWVPEMGHWRRHSAGWSVCNDKGAIKLQGGQWHKCFTWAPR